MACTRLRTHRSRSGLSGLTHPSGAFKGLAKTIRAMADGTLDSQVGARICNGLGIMRMCFETQKLEELEVRMGEISRVVGARPAIPAPLSIDHETYGSSH
jgi:hypothetical protein